LNCHTEQNRAIEDRGVEFIWKTTVKIDNISIRRKVRSRINYIVNYKIIPFVLQQCDQCKVSAMGVDVVESGA
jgi:hypothetical protein